MSIKVNNNRPNISPPKPPTTPTSTPKTSAPAAPASTQQAKTDGFEITNKSKGNIFTGKTDSTSRSHTINGNKYTSSSSTSDSIFSHAKTVQSRGVQRADGSGRSVSITKVGGRLDAKSKTSTTKEGDLTSTVKTDQQFDRNGNVDYSSVSNKLSQNYKFGENHSATITNEKIDTNSRVGTSHTEKTSYASTRGNTTTTSSISNTSGKTLETTRDGLRFEGGKFKFDPDGIKLEGSKLQLSKDSVKYHDGTQHSRTHERTTDLRGQGGKRSTEDAARLQGQKDTARKVGAGLSILEDAGLKKDLYKTPKGDVETIHHQTNLASGQTADGKGKAELNALETKTSQESHVYVGATGLNAASKGRAEASVLHGSAEYKNEGALGTVEGKADVKVLSAGAEYSGKAQIGPMGASLEGSVGVDATVLDARVEGKYTTPGVTIGGEEFTAGVEAKGRAFVGAEAKGSGKVTASIYPPSAAVELKGEAFAGAKLEGEVKGSAGPFSVTASGSLNAGAGVEGGVSAGLDDGKLKFQANLGATLGIGASGNIAVEVDVGQIAKAGVGLAKEGVEAVDRQLDKLDVTGDNNFDMRDVEAIGSAAIDKGREVLSDAGSAISSGIDKAGDVLSDAGSAISSGLSSAADAVGSVFSGW